MTKLPTKQFQELVPKLRKEGFYKEQEQRSIVWPHYNQSLIEEVTLCCDKIKTYVDSVPTIKTEGKVGRPMTDPKDLAKAILFCEMSGLAERQAQGWLRLVSPYLGITNKLDDWVIGEAYYYPEVTFILKQVFEKTKTSDGRLCGDGTKLETSRKQNYESGKSTGGDQLTTIVDSREIVQAYDFSGTQECIAMHKMIQEVHGEILTLDAGFVDRKLVLEITERGMKPFIFPKCTVILNGSLAWKSMYLSLLANAQAWLAEYHQRSHSESFNSSFKRAFGILTKRRPLAKLSQVIARIIIHNIKRQYYFNLIQDNALRAEG